MKEVWEGSGSLPSRLRELARTEFLYEHGGADEPVYVFKHALTQEVAYESILSGRRQALHRTAAEALEAAYAGRPEERCELIAHHYSRSTETAKAIDFLELANGKAFASHAMAEAKGFFSEALKLLEGQPDTEENRRRRVVLVLKEFPVFHFSHGHQEYFELMTRHEPIVDALGDPGLRGSFLAQLGHRLWVFREYERARKMLTESAELCDAAGNAADAAHAYLILEWCDLLTGDYLGVERMRERALERLRDVPVPLLYMFCDVGLSLAHAFRGRWQDAVRTAQDGFKRGEQLSDDGMMAFCNAFTSYVYICQGDWDRAIDLAQGALAKAPTVYFRGWGQLFLAAAWCRSGQLHPGLEILASIVDLIRTVRHESGYLGFGPLLGDAYISAGEYEKALALLDELAEWADRGGARFVSGSARRLLAELSLLTNPDQQEEPLAAPLFERSIDVLREIGAENELGLALAGYGRLQRRLGDAETARGLFAEALAILDRLGTMHEPEKIKQELASLPT